MKKSFNTKKKYKLIRADLYGHQCYQIRALRDFGNVRKGELGGYVDGEHNLSHDGSAWIEDPAVVTGDARVSGNARVGGHALIGGTVKISGSATVYGELYISGDSEITEKISIRAVPVPRGRSFVDLTRNSAKGNGNGNPQP